MRPWIYSAELTPLLPTTTKAKLQKRSSRCLPHHQSGCDHQRQAILLTIVRTATGHHLRIWIDRLQRRRRRRSRGDTFRSERGRCVLLLLLGRHPRLIHSTLMRSARLLRLVMFYSGSLISTTTLPLSHGKGYAVKRTRQQSQFIGSIADSDLPPDILASLRCRTTAHAKTMGGRPSIPLNGHTNAVNSIHWSRTHAHLLASAGMDQTVHVWNVWSNDQKKSRIFRYHNAAIKDVRWSPHALSLLSCGYDCTSRLVDVEKGTEIQFFKEDQIVERIRFHPRDANLFLSGGSKGILRLWDTRCNKAVHEYLKGLGPILDIEFTADGKQFISSTDTSRSNISENAIIVWDVSRQIPLSNQVYGEAYTCPCVRYHPSDACFVAQSNANYIAIFSAKPPFKLDKYKRYEGHGVWGFPIKCNFGLDGRELATGSSDGCIYFYDYGSSKLVRKIKAFGEACIDVAFNPLVHNVVAACSWAGEVSVFEV